MILLFSKQIIMCLWGKPKIFWTRCHVIGSYNLLLYTFTDLVLGSRPVGFTSATFFSQGKMSQSSLNWDILNTVQGQQCLILCFQKLFRIARHDPNLPDKHVQNCSTWLKLAQKKSSKLLKIVQRCSKLLKFAQNCSRCLKMSHNGPASV